MLKNRGQEEVAKDLKLSRVTGKDALDRNIFKMETEGKTTTIHFQALNE